MLTVYPPISHIFVHSIFAPRLPGIIQISINICISHILFYQHADSFVLDVNDKRISTMSLRDFVQTGEEEPNIWCNKDFLHPGRSDYKEGRCGTDSEINQSQSLSILGKS